MAFLIVLGPLIIEAARRNIPFFVESNEHVLNISRYGITITALTVALLILHAWLPAGRRRFVQILPGIIFTMVASLISGAVFGKYLARFANNYVTMYAGLASVVIALVFLYFIAAIFVLGGELNAMIIKSRLPRGMSLQAAQSLKPAELTGLSRKASAPAARAAASSSLRPEIPMIGMLPSGGGTVRMRRIVATPSMPGSTMSMSTASKAPCASRSGAASPSPMNSA